MSIWTRFKNFFAITPALTTAMTETSMYLGATVTPKARIEPIGHQYGLFDQRDGTLVGTYGRARDAKRGAKRRGYAVA